MLRKVSALRQSESLFFARLLLSTIILTRGPGSSTVFQFHNFYNYKNWFGFGFLDITLNDWHSFSLLWDHLYNDKWMQNLLWPREHQGPMLSGFVLLQKHLVNFCVDSWSTAWVFRTWWSTLYRVVELYLHQSYLFSLSEVWSLAEQSMTLFYYSQVKFLWLTTLNNYSLVRNIFQSAIMARCIFMLHKKCVVKINRHLLEIILNSVVISSLCN